MPTSVLIIGAGLTGLTAAHELTQTGCNVTLLDKGRGVGGRLATRRIDAARLDHGAQYFTVRTPEFRHLVDELLQQGIVHEWAPVEEDQEHPRYVGSQGMNALAKYLARNLDVRTGERVIRIAAEGVGCRVWTESGQEYRADQLILTCPVPQALALLADSDLTLTDTETEALKKIVYQPCLAALATLAQPTRLPAPGLLRFSEGPVSLVADNQQKGISPDEPSVTIHASHAFSQTHLEDGLDAVGRHLLQAVSEWVPADTIRTVQVHRWRYSFAEQRHPEPFLEVNKPLPMLLGGDAFGGWGNVEGAFLSGLAMARHLTTE